jgi:hypothetical protein
MQCVDEIELERALVVEVPVYGVEVSSILCFVEIVQAGV